MSAYQPLSCYSNFIYKVSSYTESKFTKKKNRERMNVRLVVVSVVKQIFYSALNHPFITRTKSILYSSTLGGKCTLSVVIYWF